MPKDTKSLDDLIRSKAVKENNDRLKILQSYIDEELCGFDFHTIISLASSDPGGNVKVRIQNAVNESFTVIMEKQEKVVGDKAVADFLEQALSLQYQIDELESQ
ncbi:MAG: hypothetical protein KAR20_24515 [Candidatus Heimdallarchaeota archaeon]|nr:hypothetical protein [Candidatus Heimdallarchaeota archaeon]